MRDSFSFKKELDTKDIYVKKDPMLQDPFFLGKLFFVSGVLELASNHV